MMSAPLNSCENFASIAPYYVVVDCYRLLLIYQIYAVMLVCISRQFEVNNLCLRHLAC